MVSFSASSVVLRYKAAPSVAHLATAASSFSVPMSGDW